MLLIGITGKKNAGKDTIADHLVSQHGFIKHSFAAPLKDACRTLFLLTDEQLTDPIQKEEMDARWKITPRRLFQIVGTDMMRTAFGDDFWIRHIDHWILEERPERLVVPDVRFPNEAAWIKKNGGVLIRVRSFPSATTDDNHASETMSDEIIADIEIQNDKTAGIESLHKQVDDYIS